jgi:hypothetical protein
MKKIAVLAGLFLASSAYADSENQFRARLTGFQEVPAVSTVAGGRFEAQVTGGGQFIDYTLSYSGLQGTVTQAHIHVAQKSVNGAIVVWLCGTTTNPGPTGTQTCPQSGTITGTIRAANVVATPLPPAGGQQIAAGELAEVIRAMRGGVAYVNVHTDLSPGGEIRGQIRASGDDD